MYEREREGCKKWKLEKKKIKINNREKERRGKRGREEAEEREYMSQKCPRNIWQGMSLIFVSFSMSEKQEE